MSVRAPPPPPVDPVPSLPTRVHVELTNRCNSKCHTCFRTLSPEPDRDMDPRDAERIVEGLPALTSVALHVNGEPLLYPYLPRVLQTLERKGIFVVLNTNGLALHGRRAAWIVDSGLDCLNVSLDAATAETYRTVRGVDSFRRVVSNVESLLVRRGPPPASPRVALWMVASRHNVHELPALVELAAKVGADEVYLQRIVHFGAGLARAEDSIHGRLSAAERGIIERASEAASRLGVTLRASGGHAPAEMLTSLVDPEPWRACRRPWQSSVVLTDGDVVPCCISTFIAPRDETRMGNVLESGWEEVWGGERYRRHRAELIEGEGPSFCRRCGVSWSL